MTRPKVLIRDLKFLGLDKAELSVVLTDDAGIKELNRKFRRINKPTDVLSFPQNDPSVLGDVVISVERAAHQAAKFKVSMGDELDRLLVHGILHLLGYDHVKGGTQAARMRERETEVLKTIA